jgi:hypothetical protein
VRCAILTTLTMLSSFLAVLSVPCAGQQISSIRVTVIDAQGAAVLGAEVRIVGQPSLIGLPAPNGTFSFKAVPPGTYQVTAKYPGFRDKTLCGVVVTEGKTTELEIKMEQGPPKAADFRIHQTLEDVHLYSKPLAELGQPAFCQDPVPELTEWYRFLWVPTFDHPVFLRVDVGSDGVGTLLTHVWSGDGGYKWGKSAKNVRKLTEEEQVDLFATLADIGFWTLPSKVEGSPNVVILDGTEWAIEGVKDGKCHVVTRYSSPLTRLFQTQFLASVAKLKPYYAPDR